jgi:hypothetical protein
VWTSAHLRNRAEGFDAGVRLAETVPLDMIAIPFGKTQQHIVVAAPSYLSGRRSPKTPTELKDHVCVRYRLPGGSIYAWEFEKRGDVLRIDVAGPLTLTSDRLVLRATVADWNDKARRLSGSAGNRLYAGLT